MNEAKYRAAEQRYWDVEGIAPARHTVGLVFVGLLVVAVLVI